MMNLLAYKATDVDFSTTPGAIEFVVLVAAGCFIFWCITRWL